MFITTSIIYESISTYLLHKVYDTKIKINMSLQNYIYSYAS